MNYPKFDIDRINKNMTKAKNAYNIKAPLHKQIRCLRNNVLQGLLYLYCIEAIELQKKTEGNRLKEMFVLRANRKRILAFLEKSKKFSVKLCEKTIYNAIMALQEAGFLCKIDRGRKLGFDIIFNPQILFFENFDDLDVDNYVNKSEDRISLKNQNHIQFKNFDSFLQSLPQRILLNKKINNNSNVNCEQTPSEKKGIHVNVFSNGEEKSPTLEDNSPFEKTDKAQTNKEGGGLADNLKKDSPHFENQSKNTQNTQIEQVKELTVKFWDYAKRMIFPSFKKMGDYEETTVLPCIAKLIAQEWLPVCKLKSREQYYQELCTRINIAAKYLSRHPNRYVPPPVKYFDVLNSQGFIGTRKMYLNLLKARKENHKKYVAKNLVRQAENAFITLKVNRKERNITEIHAHYNNRVKVLNIPEVTEAYNLLVSRIFQSYPYETQQRN